MKAKLILAGVVTVACAAFQLSAMPTKEETKRAFPAVRKMLAPSWSAMEAGNMTRSEVAVAAMKLAGEADTDAAKLLLMKGAFVLYVKDGNIEKAVETMNTLEKTISGMPREAVMNMVETALQGVSGKVDADRLYRLIGKAKAEAGAPRPSRLGLLGLRRGTTRVRKSDSAAVSGNSGGAVCKVKTGSSSPFYEKDSLVNLKLKDDLVMSFVNCPAGRFKMGYSKAPAAYEAARVHDVVLTRPFMIGQCRVTYGQLLALGINKGEKDLEFPVAAIEPDVASEYCCRLTEIYGKFLPKGYVFRLPTAAEWEYALRFGEDDEHTISRLTKIDRKWGVTTKNGMTLDRETPANKIGLYGMADQKEILLDSVDLSEMCKDGKDLPGRFHIYNTENAFRYESEEVNPVRIAKGKNARHVLRYFGTHNYSTRMCLRKDDAGMINGFRVVIGPDVKSLNVYPQKKAAPQVSKEFKLGVTPGTITELGLESALPLQFVYCPPGKFTMGYKEEPALSKVKDVEISSPFWITKTLVRGDQMKALGLKSCNTNLNTGASISDVSLAAKRFPDALTKRFGKLLPPGYVFRLPTEAEFEYLQKAGTKDGDPERKWGYQNKKASNCWGVEELFASFPCFLDRLPEARNGDIANRGTTDLTKVSYENQPGKDPLGWSDDRHWHVFRRLPGRKLYTYQGGPYPYNFFLVVAPDVDKLNKFIWK